jgi:hypothetical protein
LIAIEDGQVDADGCEALETDRGSIGLVKWFKILLDPGMHLDVRDTLALRALDFSLRANNALLSSFDRRTVSYDLIGNLSYIDLRRMF